MAAPVRIESAAFSDPRIDLLGQLAGYSRYEALGRLAHLWSACTEKQLHVASESLVRACIGPAGVQHMLDSEMAERVDGGLRIKGTDGRIEWLGDLSSKRQHAGRERAAKAARDARGRLLSSTPPAHAGHAGPSTSSTHQHPSSTPPAQSSALTPTSTSTNTPVAESISGHAPATPDAEKAKPGPRRRQMPADWMPARSAANLAAESVATARGISLGLELTKAKDWAASNAATKADWDSFWRNWTRNAKPVAAQTSLDRQLDRVRMLQAQEAAEDAAGGGES